MLFTTYLPVTLAVVALTIAITWIVVRSRYKERIEDLEGRVQLRDDQITDLTRGKKELSEQLQSVTAKLDKYNRERAYGFHPTIDQIANGLIGLADSNLRRIPIKIIATSEAHPFAKQLATALTSMGYGVIPNAEKTHTIIPARSTHNTIVVRYEQKATDPLRNSLCRDMSTGLQHIIAHEVHLFSPGGEKDYFQIELLGEP